MIIIRNNLNIFLINLLKLYKNLFISCIYKLKWEYYINLRSRIRIQISSSSRRIVSSPNK